MNILQQRQENAGMWIISSKKGDQSSFHVAAIEFISEKHTLDMVKPCLKKKFFIVDGRSGIRFTVTFVKFDITTLILFHSVAVKLCFWKPDFYQRTESCLSNISGLSQRRLWRCEILCPGMAVDK